ncbi:hypothetical protein NP511_04850 [Natrinema thermotolerans]|uniref:Uncharacterized protein n=1 Tax=Natrinema thermotolerans TaxID=121872 RepID=A0AAF0PD19_9EURY|nr:hypothetical protein [Natrinema thermotolerans]QCC57868.1 hypothetical protein DVR14_04140 [Natrinema thermotolerans]WMT08961.1 hypothetical protein NP511_04850 [Natrinema thermotolerans]
MRTDITLRGSKADQFERIQNHLEDRRGHELSRADVVGALMADFEQDLENTRGGSVRRCSGK